VRAGAINSANETASNALNTASDAADLIESSLLSGLGMKVDYSTFTTANLGELYFHGFNAITGASTDTDGWVYWNGAKVTIPNGMINPNTICPYNIRIYIVHRTSNSTRYLVWWNTSSKIWQYSAAQPTAVGGTWTWDVATDIVIVSFVEPGSEAAIVGAILYTLHLTVSCLA